MPTFIYTAINKDGVNVTEKVDADNLAQAKTRLEFQGYTAVSFYNGDLTGDIDGLFDPELLDRAKSAPAAQQAGAMTDTRLVSKLVKTGAAVGVLWSIIGVLFYFGVIGKLPLWFAGSFAVVVYFSAPLFIYDRIMNAHLWGRNESARFWIGLAKKFNELTVVKIPDFELDVLLACAAAREKGTAAGIAVINHWLPAPHITKRLKDVAFVRIYDNARDYEAMAAKLRELCSEDDAPSEFVVDYAVCNALRLRRPEEARLALERIADSPMTKMAEMIVSYCSGLVEVEEGNYDRGEHQIRNALNYDREFRNNTFLDGFRVMMKASLAHVLARRGNMEEARKLFEEARPLLEAGRESEMIAQCESVIGN